LVEPPAVARDPKQPGTLLLLDGHLRIEILKDLGETEVESLVSTDDEAFTYNKRISRLAAVQEHKMILRAIERGVPEEKRSDKEDVSAWLERAQAMDEIDALARSFRRIRSPRLRSIT
jgi:hypothetical protein